MPTDAEDLAAHPGKNADCYAQLVNALRDKSLSLIRHEAAEDGRKALKILKEHYSGKSKPRILNLYTSLTAIQMANKTVTDYMISTDTVSVLRDAGVNMRDGRLITTILNGLKDSFRPLAAHITQNSQRTLRACEESGVMKMRATGKQNWKRRWSQEIC